MHGETAGADDDDHFRVVRAEGLGRRLEADKDVRVRFARRRARRVAVAVHDPHPRHAHERRALIYHVVEVDEVVVQVHLRRALELALGEQVAQAARARVRLGRHAPLGGELVEAEAERWVGQRHTAPSRAWRAGRAWPAGGACGRASVSSACCATWASVSSALRCSLALRLGATLRQRMPGHPLHRAVAIRIVNPHLPHVAELD